MRGFAVLIRAGLALACALLVCAGVQAQPIVVFAAASMKNALDEIASLATARPVISYGASSTLARQIESGAPAQVFIAADIDWMDYLEQRKLLRAGTRRTLAGNRLALIAPAASRTTIDLRPGFDLAGMIGGNRLAIADPRHVPAGKYARAALESLGAWSSVAARLAPSENVRAALALVARGETPLGVVYASDAAADPKVKVLAMFPPATHPAILYPAALTSMAPATGAAAEFLSLLGSPAARKVFEAHGFTPLN